MQYSLIFSLYFVVNASHELPHWFYNPLIDCSLRFQKHDLKNIDFLVLNLITFTHSNTHLCLFYWESLSYSNASKNLNLPQFVNEPSSSCEYILLLLATLNLRYIHRSNLRSQTGQVTPRSTICIQAQCFWFHLFPLYHLSLTTFRAMLQTVVKETNWFSKNMMRKRELKAGPLIEPSVLSSAIVIFFIFQKYL